MKQRYIFWYNVEEAWKASFLADSDEHAEELLEQMQNGEIEFSDLPGYWEKNKGIETDIDVNSIEFVGYEE